MLGPDSRGRVRGMGMGVSKTTMHYIEPYMTSCQALQTQVDDLKEHLTEETGQLKMQMGQIIASLSQGRTHMRSSTNHGSSTQVKM